jgi:PAS domain S-box-containing protein
VPTRLKPAPDRGSGTPVDGEMRARLLGFDWSQTPLGAFESWPQSLRTAAEICVGSRFPLWVGLGKEFYTVYNDAYIPILGPAKHPRVFGRPTREVWPEIYHIIGPMLDGVYAGRESTWSKDQILMLDRNGMSEETYFTWSFSPIENELGGIGGVFTAASETTVRVLSERRLQTLRDLAEQAGEARTAEDACRRAARTLEEKTFDVPFSLFYLADNGSRVATLAATSGFARHSTTACPATIDLEAEREGTWPLSRVRRLRQSVEQRDPASLFGPLPGGPWPESPSIALVHPLARRGEEGLYGFMIAGVSPRRPLDQDYRTFLRLVADQVSITLGNAVAHEDERRRSEQLAELDRAKTHFFSNVSHELRTPLTLILGPMENALHDSSRGLTGDTLGAAHRNALRLLKLVNTLLDFSRIESGRIQASFERVDLSELTRDLAGVFRSLVEAAGLRLVLDCPPIEGDIYVDPVLWEKVVLNLMSNAYKFTFQGEITVRLRSGGGRVSLEVSDTGSGIPDEELPRLFERFHRIHGARSRTFEGSGIGLALVKELVSLHGGTITVHSQEGRGSTFRVELPTGKKHLPSERIASDASRRDAKSLAPLFLEEAGSWGTAPAQAEAPPAAPPSRAGGRVLVVDDNADMRAYIERLLQDRFEVESAVDGLEALERVRERSPDLILSDVMMPRLDGLGLLKALRSEERTRSIPLILVSARAGEESRIEGLEWGADDYLIKPFSAQELLARVASHLNLARLRRESELAVRRSEEHLRSALQAARMYAWQWDVETGRTHVSENARAITGSPDHLDERIAWANVHPDDGPGLREKVARAMSEAASFVHRLRFRRFDTGEWIWLETRGQALRDPDGRVRRIVGLAMDVTAIEKASAEVRALNASLERKVEERTARLSEALQELETFAYSVAHDLRGPLRAMNQYSDILTEEYGPRLGPEGEEFARRIASAAQRMDRLTSDLLEYSRLARSDLGIDTVALEPAVREVLDALQLDLKRARAEVQVELPVGSVRGNRFLLSRALENLISNAIKFVAPGIRPRVTVRSAPAEGGKVRVRVEDNGIGIDPAHHGKLFRVFERLDPQGPYTGTGIGLAIARKAVERMGGTVGVESEVGKGSAFWIELPEGGHP